MSALEIVVDRVSRAHGVLEFESLLALSLRNLMLCHSLVVHLETTMQRLEWFGLLLSGVRFVCGYVGCVQTSS